MARIVLNNGDTGLVFRGALNNMFTELYADALNYPEVLDFASLPPAASHSGETYLVQTTTGVWLVNRRQAGLYRSNGTVWNWLGDVTDEASEVAVVPTGGIAATNVQDALAELDTEKLVTTHQGAGGAVHANVVAAGAAGFMTGADKTKLDGVAAGATVNSSDATLLARANHTGTQPISTILAAATARFFGRITASGGAGEELTGTQATSLLDLATTALKGLLSAADKTKLDGIAAGATVNSSDATLLARANHTGTQLMSTISNAGTAATKNIHVATTAPGSPAVGDLWVDTT